MTKMLDKKVILLILSVLVILFLIGVTYSFFTGVVIGNDEAKSDVVETGTLSIKYTNSNELRGNNIMPGWTEIKTFTVENTGTVKARYNINWNNLLNEFINKEDLVYSLTSDNNGGMLEESVLPSSGEHIRIISDIDIEPGVVQTYTLTITYKNKDKDQSIDSNKKLVGKIEVLDINEDKLGSLFGVDKSNANAPELNDLIPEVNEVVGNDYRWKMASLKQEDWYNYDKQIWANAFSIDRSKSINYAKTIDDFGVGDIVGATYNTDSIALDGINDYIDTNVQIDLGKGLSFAFRVKFNSYPTNAANIVVGNPESGGFDIYFTNTGYLCFEIFNGSSYSYVSSKTKLELNKYYTVSANYDLEKMSLYINGEKQNEKVLTTFKNSNLNVVIGANIGVNGVSGQYTDCNMTDFIMYNTSLGESFIKNKFSGVFKMELNPSALVYYIFDKKRQIVEGTSIPQVAIKGHYVWIPRFKYISPNSTSETQLNVKFERGINKTDDEFYTHPAFTYGKELTGFWVGKFNPSDGVHSSLSDVIPNEIYIKGGFRSIKGQRVYYQFVSALEVAKKHDIASSFESHMMKNSEWGAISALSMSKYGKYGNYSYSGTNKEIYINNSSYGCTGRSSGFPGSDNTITNLYGSYHYRDGLVNSSGVEDFKTTSETINKGGGASTTGNKYGVFDMVGPYLTRVMGVNINATACIFNCLNNITSSGFTTGIDKKYYDSYTTTGIKGDFTNMDGTRNWYGDSASFLTDKEPWFVRGGDYSSKKETGIFSYLPISGDSANTTFKVILSSK